ncbi:MAG: hypothetical protein ACK4F4_07220 [Hylemonella sp.]|uniref:hypothetical protein n=1 Tax=Hylemonella sp. TaxID=2066020 RepID=UPI00391AE4F1
MSTTETPPTDAPLPPHIEVMRQHLMDTLRDLRNREQPMDVDRARAVADVARVMVDSAKVEVDYIRATGADRSDFLEGKVTNPALPTPSGTPSAHQPFPTRTVHKLRG